MPTNEQLADAEKAVKLLQDSQYYGPYHVYLGDCWISVPAEGSPIFYDYDNRVLTREEMTVLHPEFDWNPPTNQ